MSDRVSVRFLRPFRAYRRNDVIPNMDIGQARSWQKAGLVQIVTESQQPLLEVAMAEPREIRTADATPRRRRKQS